MARPTNVVDGPDEHFAKYIRGEVRWGSVAVSPCRSEENFVLSRAFERTNQSRVFEIRPGRAAILVLMYHCAIYGAVVWPGA